MAHAEIINKYSELLIQKGAKKWLKMGLFGGCTLFCTLLAYIGGIIKLYQSDCPMELVKNGFVEPIMVNERIRSHQLSDFAKQNEKETDQKFNKT